RLASPWSLMASGATQKDDIRKFEEVGTHPAANLNAISDALVFNDNIGIDRKAARLRYLRDRWALRLAQNPKCKILHSPDPAQSYGIDPSKIASALVNKYSIYTSTIGHEEYTGLRSVPFGIIMKSPLVKKIFL